MTVDLAFSLVICVVHLATLVQLRLGLRRLKRLNDVPLALPEPPPRVSVIFAARDEASTLAPALRSLLALDYPQLEIVAVDDRSSDATGTMLAAMAQTDARLRVISVRQLPEGWLGKTHALQRAGELATGRWLLFTDADVIFEPDALRRAVSYCEAEALDHLVVIAELTAPSSFLQSVLLNFYTYMFMGHAPWKVRSDPKVYIGMGAFNMVRAEAYRKVGAHEPLRLEVVDDLHLGQLMKRSGMRQDALQGLRAVHVRWYPTLGDFKRGLEKNSFAMVDYRASGMALLVTAGLIVHYGPLLGLWLAQGAAWWLNLAAVSMSLLVQLSLLPQTRYRLRCLAWWPLSPAYLMFVTSRAVALTLWRGGIAWRGTRYPLAALRAARAASGFGRRL